MKQSLKIAMVYNGTFEYRTGILTVIENLTKQYLKAGHQVYLFKRHKIPYIVTNHGLLSKIYAENAGNNIKKSLFNIIGRYLYRGADVVTTVSYAVKEDIINAYKVDPSKIFVIPNGIDDFWLNDLPPDKINETREKLGLTDKGPILFFLRPAEKRKGLHFLLKSLGEIKGEFPNIRLLVAGQISDSDYTWEIRRLIAELHLDENMIFLGNVPQKDLPVFYKMASLTVVPSLYEPFGIVILESYACGTPVVAFDAGGVRDIIQDGIDGNLIPLKDVEALTCAIKNMLNNPEVRNMMGIKAKTKLENQYKWEHISKKYIELYRRSL